MHPTGTSDARDGTAPGSRARPQGGPAEQLMRPLRRLYGLLFLGYGPAQLDEVDRPPTAAPDDAWCCPLCTRAMADHELTATPSGRHMQCPAAAATA